MAAPAPVPEALRMLKEMFGSLEENMVRKVYEDYKNHAHPFDAAVSELLTLAAVQEDQQAKKNASSNAKPAQPDAPTPEAIQQVTTMFPDLTRSVIGGALFQNQGHAQGAIELLLDIGEDKDAIAQIRDMNPEKKAQYANDKAREREAQLAERAAALAREREENAKAAVEQKRLRDVEKLKQAEADTQANKVRLELVALMEAKLAAEVATERALAKKREYEAQAEAVRVANEAQKAAETEALARMEEQKERDAQLAKEAQEELQRRWKAAQARQENPEVPLDLGQSIADLKDRAARKAIEQVRAQEEAGRVQARIAEMEARDRMQREQLEQLAREKEALRSCTLNAEYSQRDKKLVVSWVLGDTRAPTSYDWIGVFSVGATDAKQYHTYISTESLKTSSHECPLPTEPGLYVCCFFYGKSQDMLATSAQIYLGPSLELNATADPVRSIITLHWRVKTGNPTKKDWIGFYRSDKPHKTYIEYKWLEPDVAEGVWEVKMPRRGGYDYEFRFFSHQVRVPLQTSNKVALPKNDFLTVKNIDVLEGLEAKHAVHWTIVAVDCSSWDWIELINLDTNTRVTWSYVDVNSGSLKFNVPRTPGRYEYRYWAKSIGSGAVAKSPEFTVENRDKVTAAVVDGLLQVTWDIHSIDLNTSCWVGIFAEGATKYTTFQYINPANKTLSFSPAAGSFDARFFSSADKHNPVAKSAVVSFN